MNENYVAISELSSIDSFSDRDEIFVTRCDNTTGENVFISYKANLGSFVNNLSSAITDHAVNEFYTPVSNYFVNKFAKIQTDFNELTTNYDRLSTHYYGSDDSIIDHDSLSIVPHYKKLSADLSTLIYNKMFELNLLSTRLSTAVSTYIDTASCQINIFENTLSNNLCTWLSNSMKQLSIWVSNNFVNLTGNQTITGQKTFTKDISGTALSAKWI